MRLITTLALVAITISHPVASAIAQSSPSASAAAAIDPAARARVEKLLPLLSGKGDYAAYFAEEFRKHVTADQFTAVLTQLNASVGAPAAVKDVRAQSPWLASVVVEYQRGTVTFQLGIDPSAPHQATGLAVVSTAPLADNWQKLSADFAALPGQSGFGVYKLDDAGMASVAAYRAEEKAPVASTFKLWVLGAAAVQAKAGTIAWKDVVPLAAKSLPSGILQSWPDHSPMTLQSLATLMITISDNTATDALMQALQPKAITEQAAATGLDLPVLSTRQAFAIKGDARLREAWATTNSAGREKLLATERPRLDRQALDINVLTGKPVATESVEWFASPTAVARQLNVLRRLSDTTPRDILAVNPGVAPAIASRFSYIGYKGGSEPGVIALSYVMQTKDGQWYAVSGNWHRADEVIDEAQFVALMSRVVMLVAP